MSKPIHHPPAAADMLVEGATPPSALDANGFDPAEFEWRPVARRPRSDGWTPDVQRRFIQALAETGLVQEAAHAVDMSVQSAYRLRTAPGSEGFARAWTAALHIAADRLADLAFARAIEGEEVPIFDRDGVRIGATRRVNDRMMMFLLRAHRPDRYSVAHRVEPTAHPAPAPEQPLSDAIAALGPVAPADPHRLMAPAALEQAIDTARAVAMVHERYPADDREPYAAPRVPDDHPVTHERRRKRRERMDRAEARRRQ